MDFVPSQVFLEELLSQARSNDWVSQTWPLLGNRDGLDGWSAVDVVAHASCSVGLKVIIIIVSTRNIINQILSNGVLGFWGFGRLIFN